MAFINNTPMVMGGGTPTPTTKKYKMGMKAISCTVTRSGTNLTIMPEANTEFTKFYDWLRTYLYVPRPFVMTISQSGVSNSSYGMYPSYPLGSLEKDATIRLSFSSGKLYDAPLDNTKQIVIVNATVAAGANAIVVSNANIYSETNTIDSKNLYSVTRKALSKNGDDLHFTLGIPVIEESEE